MSKYTTGELAKLCDVSVRTVQYYDTRKILVPSEISEGGRRIYNDEDLRKMKIICFLRELELSIDNIKDIFNQDDPEKVIATLLDEQEKVLKSEILEKQQKLEYLNQSKKAINHMSQFDVNSMIDVAQVIKSNKEMKAIRKQLIICGIIAELAEISAIIFLFKRMWLCAGISILIFLAFGIYLSVNYFNKVSYICPECHDVFVPKFKEAFFANHTPFTRKLTCPNCGRKGFCVETYRTEEK